MKYLRILLCLSIVAFSASISVALADDPFDSNLPETSNIAVAKQTDSTAKVTFTSKDSVVVPITFASGASWDNVKDNYTVNDQYVGLLKAGKVTITINSDDSASFNIVKSSAKAEGTKKK